MFVITNNMEKTTSETIPHVVCQTQMMGHTYTTLNIGRTQIDGGEGYECVSISMRDVDEYSAALDVVRKSGAMMSISPEEAMAIADHFGAGVAGVRDIVLMKAKAHYEEIGYTFTYKGGVLRLDFDTRQRLRVRMNAEKAKGLATTTIWYDGIRYDLPISPTEQMLTALEVYALECHDVYNAHVAAVNAMDDAEAIAEYDYKAGYPDELNF